MLSFLIISENQQKKTDYLFSYFKENGIDALDVITVIPETSLGVEDIRNLQKKAHLAPLRGSIKVIVIDHMQLATTEAQNALLKLLEEPPLKTQIILTATTLQHFLPTVLSRCKIITLDSKKETIAYEEQLKYQEEFDAIISAGIPQRLKFAQNLTADKENMQQWLKNMIVSLRNQMLTDSTFELVNPICKLQETLNKLQTTNINPRMLLENVLINL